MEQVLRNSNHNPPNVRSRCILANLYKAKKHLDRGGWIGGEKQKREKNHSIIPSFSNWTQGRTLSHFLRYFQLNVTTLHRVFYFDFYLLLQNGYLKVDLSSHLYKLIVWVNSNWIKTNLNYLTYFSSTTHLIVYL